MHWTWAEFEALPVSVHKVLIEELDRNGSLS
jgi:hypothetical protein